MAIATQFTLDPTVQFYAAIGAGGLAVEKTIEFFADAQEFLVGATESLAKLPKQVDPKVFDPKAFDAKAIQAKFEEQFKDFPAELKALPALYAAQLKEFQADLLALPGKLPTQAALASRGEDVVGRLLGTNVVATSAEDTEDVAEKAEAVAEPVAKKTAKKAPAKKAAAKKTTAKKTTAKKPA
ncbi:MAG: hypothetical protein QM655_15440 [Nocardioidaceae bacterium]